MQLAVCFPTATLGKGNEAPEPKGEDCVHNDSGQGAKSMATVARCRGSGGGGWRLPNRRPEKSHHDVGLGI